MGANAVLPKKEALPGAEKKPGTGERDRFAAPRECHLDVAGHVVGPFEGVLVSGAVWNEIIEVAFQIGAGGGVGILHEDEAAAGMPAKHREDSIGESGSADCGIRKVR